MKIKTIVDTSVWIEYFKEKADIVPIVDEGLLAGTVFMVGPVLTELLQGVKTNKELDKLAGCIDAVPFIGCHYADWHLAGVLSFKLRKEGVTIPLTDLLIAAQAINNGVSVFTFDHHFKRIPGVSLRG